MKRIGFYLIILSAGSLWGLIEAAQLPVMFLCALGVLFLSLSRSFYNIPGSSIAVGIVACIYKTFSQDFFICQWAGIMSLAISYDLLTSLLLKDKSRQLVKQMTLGFASNLTAFIVFVFIIVIILQHPFWVSEGINRVIDYALNAALPAALGSILTAPLGFQAGKYINEIIEKENKKFSFSFPLGIVVIIWGTALIMKLI